MSESTGQPVHHLSPFSNIQVVLLANRNRIGSEAFGANQRFGLLEIANKTILVHILSQFQKYGLNNILFVCLAADRRTYSEFLTSNGFDFVNVYKVNDEMTTCEILRSIPKCEHNLIYPIDLITTIDFTKFIDFHITRKSAITAFITEHKLDVKELDNSPGIRANAGSSTGRHFFVTDESDPARLVSILAESSVLTNDIDLCMKQSSIESDDSTENMDEIHDYSCSMEISATSLQAAKSLIIDCSSHLTRSYLINSDGMDFLCECDDIHSLENELLPRILSNQKSVSLFKDDNSDFTISVTDYATLYHINLRCAAGKLNGLNPDPLRVPIGETGNAFFAPPSFAPPETFKKNPFSVFGNDVVIGEGATVHRSIIGNGVVIGAGAQLMNCVIFDHVRIEDNASLQSTMVGAHTTVPARSKLQKVFIVPYFKSAEALNAKQCVIKHDN